MKFTAVGDLLMQRRMPGEYDGFAEVRDYIAKGDFRFANLETTLNHIGTCYGSQYSGGTWLRAEPEILEDVAAYGFNVLSFNNNHSMDYSYDGLLQTLEYIREYGFVNAGVGENLAQASAPAYLDTPKGRIALISVTASFNAASMAGEQGRRLPGRPGVNGLRISSKLIVTPQQLEYIKEIGEATGINISKQITRKEGYYPELEEGCAELGELQFKAGDKPSWERKMNKADLARIAKAIEEAKFSADYIMVSIHAHQCADIKARPAEFLYDFAHFCIDNGAHGVIGHGPHLLRGIEVYKECPIFYSLGDFMTQVESGQVAPEDFYAKYGLTSDATMYELFKTRTDNFRMGLMTQQVMFETVIPYWEMEDGKLTKLELMPVEENYALPRSRSGFPSPAKDTSILERLAELSAPLGTTIEIKDGIGIVKLG